MEQARLDFRRLVGGATPADLRRPSDGTRWTNRQLLFHMLFGYRIVRALLILVRVFGLLPDGASKAFAVLLDSARRPFGLINYLGSCAGARIIPPRRMPAMLDHAIAALGKRLQREAGSALRRGMHYPTTWDPFFSDYMTLAAIYRYPTRHFRFHQRQLTLSPPRERPGARPGHDRAAARVSPLPGPRVVRRRRRNTGPFHHRSGPGPALAGARTKVPGAGS